MNVKVVRGLMCRVEVMCGVLMGVSRVVMYFVFLKMGELIWVCKLMVDRECIFRLLILRRIILMWLELIFKGIGWSLFMKFL